MMKRFLVCGLLATALSALAASPVTINVGPGKGDMTRTIQKAIDRAASQSAKGHDVVLVIAPGVYDLSRQAATPVLYHVSNTTADYENANPVKHIGLYFKDIANLTVKADGAKFVTHGEMTPWVIDGCRNIVLSGFTVDAADPSVPEMTVESITDSSFVARVHSRSRYSIDDKGRIHWIGEGWDFTGGIAQVYDSEALTTLRCGSPVVDSKRVIERGPGVVEFVYPGKLPAEIRRGVTYQMRHSFRTEVAGFINRSTGVTLENLQLYFMGNFGIVAQMSENVSYHNLSCKPDPESGRTCTGFADFLQVSGCRGLVSITGCEFAGAHDDPINVHGTHLRVVGQPAPDCLTVRFMHNQTYGFEAFLAGDTVALVNDASLLAVGAQHVVKSARMVDDYNMELTFTSPVKVPADGRYVLENLTWTPAVEILDNTFTLTPTRGILITTRRPVVIARNEFRKIPMAAILVADDARSWYESGPVRDLTIVDNTFIDCSAPQIMIEPENIVNAPERKVHSSVVIERNAFRSEDPKRIIPAAIRARSVDGLTLRNNYVQPGLPTEVNLRNCLNISIDRF